jgi:hypothetical protein
MIKIDSKVIPPMPEVTSSAETPKIVTSKSYKDVTGWFAFEPFYNHIAETYLTNDMNIAEVGAYMGKSTAFMANKLKTKKLKTKFYVVDHWRGSAEHGLVIGLYETFLNNMEDCNVSKYITPLRLESVDAAATFPDKFFDFVFLDASHDYDSVKKDIQAWLPKVKPGGILAGDDYIEGWDGVIKAVNECFGWNVQKEFVGSQTWYVKV